MAITNSTKCAANEWVVPYTLCKYLHFKIVLDKFKGWLTNGKSVYPSSLLLALETLSLIASLFKLQYWPVNLFIILENCRSY